MSRDKAKCVTEACGVIEQYRRTLVERMASEIVEQKEDFESPFLGSAEALVEKYYHLFSCLYSVTSEMSAYLGDRRSGSERSED